MNAAMDIRRSWPLLLCFLVCALGACSTTSNGRGVLPNLSRKNRRIGLHEFLVPPPLPQPNYQPTRTGRYANHKESQGYLSRFMAWLGPFASESRAPPPRVHQPRHIPLNNGYYPTDQQTNPSSIEYNRNNNCNPCNKEPWIPIQGGAPHHPPPSFPPPPPQEQTGIYGPPDHHDVHGGLSVAASQEVKFSKVPYAVPQIGQDDRSRFVPPTNPHLYPGPMPPLFQARPFNYLHDTVAYKPQNIPDSNVDQISISNGNIYEDPPINIIQSQDSPEHGVEQVPTLNGNLYAASPIAPPEPQNIPDNNVHEILSTPDPVNGNFYEENLSTQSTVDDSNRLRYNSDLVPSGSHPEQQAPNSDVTKNDQSSNLNWHFQQSPVLEFGQDSDFNKDDSFQNAEDLFDDPKPSSNVIEEFYTVLPTSQENQSSQQSSGESKYPWDSSIFLSTTTSRPNLIHEHLSDYEIVRNDSRVHENSVETNNTPNGAKRSKQVQVIIPYTSQYTPLPFQQAHESLKGKPERTQSRLIPYTLTDDRYYAEESRNEIKIVEPPKSTKKSTLNHYISSTTPMSVDRTVKSDRLNTSIDVRRLQKNIDNWTIQEYSRGTTLSTALPSSLRPYLSPSKKIPEEYLTTTEPIDAPDMDDFSQEDIVKSFALTGFSFNDLDLRSINEKLETRKDIKKEKEIAEADVGNVTQKARELIHEDRSKKERVYIVTAMPVKIREGNSTDKEQKSRLNERKKEERLVKKETVVTVAKNESESVETAYQVLPQAVNNLAVASTVLENVPLWGIMEHEDFASADSQDPVDAVVNSTVGTNETKQNKKNTPVLYSGHSKVSRVRRRI
ncbi:uncharacterized protein [Prorops nasuta]|uniref:uncharacterized protein n=1 Tax=Prorops nasuta TaxID=863751 RepID=UPI0034CD8166